MPRLSYSLLFFALMAAHWCQNAAASSNILISSADELITAVGVCNGYTAHNYTIINVANPVTATLGSKQAFGGTVCAPQLSSISCSTFTYSVKLGSDTPSTVSFTVSATGKCTATCSFEVPTAYDCFASCIASDNPESYWVEKHTFYYCGISSQSRGLTAILNQAVPSPAKIRA